MARGWEMWLEFVVVLALTATVLAVVRRVMGRSRKQDAETDFRNKLVMMALAVVSLVILLIVAPLEAATRGQLLQLVGLMLSAAVALSSTTILGNAMAGFMQRAVGNFVVGDYLRVGEHFGRVTERGLFHTEIQTEQRDLVTLPNLTLATEPVRVIRRSGTIVSAEVSLGYDLDHAAVEPLLVEAAAEAGLEDPFVQVRELGDFAVTYRTAGLLADVGRLLTVRSRLRQTMLDALHDGGIEIASPTLMSTRAYPPQQAFMPAVKPVADPSRSAETPEEVIFDKADEAATLASLQDLRARLAERIKAATGEDQKALEARLEGLEATIARREAEKSEGSE